MSQYRIIYDYCSEDGYEEKNLVEDFSGSHVELQDYIRSMRADGCYNISAESVSE